jgi:regulatory protein
MTHSATTDGPATPGEPGEPSPESVARQIALKALTMAPRTRAELAELMKKRDVPPDAAHEVLDRFADVGLIDDAAFARAWVDSRHAGRGLGRRALGEELHRRGVEKDVAAEALGQVSDDDELEAARRLVRRKLTGMGGLEPATRDRRLLGMLARRGHSAGTSWAAIRAEVADAATPPVDLDD